MKNIIQERDENDIQRRRFKKRFDDAITFSSGSGQRLLDEGAVIEGEDYVRCIFAKGTLEKFLNGENEYLPNIDDEYMGYIKISHADFYNDPLCLIGTWKKSNLSLVDIGNGRKGLNVEGYELYDWHYAVKALKEVPYTVGFSVEILGHINWVMTETIGEIVYDEIYMSDFAVVGSGANVNSNGLTLKGENMKKKELEKLQEALNRMESENDTTLGSEPAEPDESNTGEGEPNDTEPNEGEPNDGEPDNDDSEDLSEVLGAINALKEKVEVLTKENNDLKERLNKKDTEINKFTEKFKSLSVDLNPDFNNGEKEEKLSEDRYNGYSDGIGV